MHDYFGKIRTANEHNFDKNEREIEYDILKILYDVI